MKLTCPLFLILLNCICLAQPKVNRQTGESGIHVAISQTTFNGAEDPDINRWLYLTNKTGDSLAVYQVSGGSVERQVIHYKNWGLNSACLFTSSTDSLMISFNDSLFQVDINNDKYVLYPQYYAELKQGVLLNHQVMPVLALLEDQLGDYSISSFLPLLQFIPHIDGKRIKKASVETARSQADDFKDTWNCNYGYNKSGKLNSVSAASGKVVYFTKRILYNGSNNVSTIKLYRNIEDRQITNKTVTYSSINKDLLKVLDIVEETGKNRQTRLRITLKRKTIPMIKTLIMQPVGVLKLIN